MQAWQADESRIRITGDQLKLGKAMQEAVYQHHEIRPLINHPGRAVKSVITVLMKIPALRFVSGQTLKYPPRTAVSDST